MASIQNIVSRALRQISVIDARQPVQAVDMATGIEALNAMMARFAYSGLIEEWTPVDNPSDTFALPAKDEDAIVSNLALRLASEYETEAPASVVAAAKGGIFALWRDRIAPNGSAGTVGAIVYRALRLLSGQMTAGFPDAFTLDGAIQALNGMCRRWEANGLAIGWQSVDTVAEPVPAPEEAWDAITFNLAETLAAEYGVVAPPAVLASASRGLTDLRCDVKSVNPLHPDRGIVPWGYDTLTDSWH